jgi:tetratricopeptide (TPR) repeat protein
MLWALPFLFAAPALAQIPEKFTNLKVLPADIPRDSLVNIMRGFSLSLNVRCQFCHVGGDGVSFKDVDFAKDDDIHKQRARFMLRMVDSLNRSVLPKLPGLTGNALRIECKTCHRGASRPLLLTQDLEATRDTGGIAAAVARYRMLREKESMEGRYDFTEWEMNLWSERLAEAGRTADAIAAYELNLEFFPRSTSIMTSLARLHEPTDRARAISYWERALAINPNAAQIRRRVDSLKALP